METTDNSGRVEMEPLLADSEDEVQEEKAGAGKQDLSAPAGYEAPPVYPGRDPAVTQEPWISLYSASEKDVRRATRSIYCGLAVMICCCWPLGVPAVVFAVRALSSAHRGYQEQTRTQLHASWTFTILSLFVGIGIIILFVIFTLPDIYNDND